MVKSVHLNLFVSDTGIRLFLKGQQILNSFRNCQPHPGTVQTPHLHCPSHSSLRFSGQTEFPPLFRGTFSALGSLVFCMFLVHGLWSRMEKQDTDLVWSLSFTKGMLRGCALAAGGWNWSQSLGQNLDIPPWVTCTS